MLGENQDRNPRPAGSATGQQEFVAHKNTPNDEAFDDYRA
jgi:hypothetical protein